MHDALAGEHGRDLLAGDDGQDLIALPEKLALKGVSIKIDKVKKCGIASLKVAIISTQAQRFRNLEALTSIVVASPYSDGVKRFSLTALTHLADAEAKVHGIPRDRVHFHDNGSTVEMIFHI